MTQVSIAAKVDKSQKEAIVAASEIVHGRSHSQTALIAEVGDQLADEVSRLKDVHGEKIPRCDVVVSLVPRKRHGAK